jgi:hypothetical protein
MTTVTPSQDSTLPAADNDQGHLGGRCGRYVVLGPVGAGGMGVVVAAHDPVLDRRVALKLLHPTSAGRADHAARIEREAQAMARLAHPNVVTVFEVDRVDDQTFVAMELVEGLTLRRWLAEQPRSWREIVAIYIAAGRGLAAAHAAGLVHRDFKPDNVLIGRDGRPRVSDFGLVGDLAGELELPAVSLSSGDGVHRGSAFGTPAYMSPEQWAGARVGARSDQFAFCAALWEAVWRQRAFQGATPSELRSAIRTGALIEPPRRPRVPRRLHAALRRGLAVDAAARWPDMSALLDALARTTGARRRWTAAAVAVVSAALFVAASARGRPDVCAPPTARIEAVWSPARRDALAAKLTARDPVRGASRFATISAALDSSARDFRAMHVEACRATRVAGRQSDALLDRRMACLDRWLDEFGATVSAIEQAGDPAALDRASRAVPALSPLAACADVRALGEILPLPDDLVRRTTASVLASRARVLDVEQRAGRLDGLTVKLSQLVADARALDHAPTLATALAVEARGYLAAGNQSAAATVLRELTQVAARAHDDRGAAFAWTGLLETIARGKATSRETDELVFAANAAVVRAGDPPALRGDLLYWQAMAIDDGAHSAEALELLAQARRVLEQAGASSPGSPLANRLADVARAIDTRRAGKRPDGPPVRPVVQ